MTAQEHAEIWQRAAKIVRDMDPRTQWVNQNLSFPSGGSGVSGGFVGRPYSQEEAAVWDAFGAAAAVLSAIAKEYANASPAA